MFQDWKVKRSIDSQEQLKYEAKLCNRKCKVKFEDEQNQSISGVIPQITRNICELREKIT